MVDLYNKWLIPQNTAVIYNAPSESFIMEYSMSAFIRD